MKLIILCLAMAAITQATCPNIQASTEVDLDEWTRATWYIQQQQVNGYQPENKLFCTLATYETTNPSVPGFSGKTVKVNNYENVDKVNGEAEGPQADLCARLPDPEKPGELLVAPCFLPNILAGPYWILAFGTDDDGKYTWGVVSGGPPTVQYDDGCTTSEKGINGSGLWIFSRVPTGASLWVSQARAKLQELGFTLQRLKPVEQEGCEYQGAVIKLDNREDATRKHRKKALGTQNTKEVRKI